VRNKNKIIKMIKNKLLSAFSTKDEYSADEVHNIIEKTINNYYDDMQIKNAVSTSDKLGLKTLRLIKKAVEKKSIITTGTYVRHLFEDIKTGVHYILDVSITSNKCFKNLKINDVLTNVQTFSQTKKSIPIYYIDGRSKAINIGQWSHVELLIKGIGFTI
jgi:hypothetical protein